MDNESNVSEGTKKLMDIFEKSLETTGVSKDDAAELMGKLSQSAVKFFVRPILDEESVVMYDKESLFFMLEAVHLKLIPLGLIGIFPEGPTYAAGALYGLAVAGLINITAGEKEEFSLTDAGTSKMKELHGELLAARKLNCDKCDKRESCGLTPT